MDHSDSDPNIFLLMRLCKSFKIQLSKKECEYELSRYKKVEKQEKNEENFDISFPKTQLNLRPKLKRAVVRAELQPTANSHKNGVFHKPGPKSMHNSRSMTSTPGTRSTLSSPNSSTSRIKRILSTDDLTGYKSVAKRRPGPRCSKNVIENDRQINQTININLTSSLFDASNEQASSFGSKIKLNGVREDQILEHPTKALLPPKSFERAHANSGNCEELSKYCRPFIIELKKCDLVMENEKLQKQARSRKSGRFGSSLLSASNKSTSSSKLSPKVQARNNKTPSRNNPEPKKCAQSTKKSKNCGDEIKQRDNEEESVSRNQTSRPDPELRAATAAARRAKYDARMSKIKSKMDEGVKFNIVNEYKHLETKFVNQFNMVFMDEMVLRKRSQNENSCDNSVTKINPLELCSDFYIDLSDSKIQSEPIPIVNSEDDLLAIMAAST